LQTKGTTPTSFCNWYWLQLSFWILPAGLEIWPPRKRARHAFLTNHRGSCVMLCGLSPQRNSPKRNCLQPFFSFHLSYLHNDLCWIIRQCAFSCSSHILCFETTAAECLQGNWCARPFPLVLAGVTFVELSFAFVLQCGRSTKQSGLSCWDPSFASASIAEQLHSENLDLPLRFHVSMWSKFCAFSCSCILCFETITEQCLCKELFC
jgi:hypothetical protein